jgi:hypothetical protein
MAKSNVSEFVVRDSSGCVDVDATIENFSSQLGTFMVETEVETAGIAQAVNAVFDTHKGVNINTPALVSLSIQSLSIQKLDVSPANYADMAEKIADYVRSNKATFLVSKGKGGGVRRICDIVEK